MAPRSKNKGKSKPPRRQPGAERSRSREAASGLDSIEARLEKVIESGRFDRAGRLPPEAILMQEFGVTRHVLRQTVAALVRRGVLRSVPHVGTFIAPKKIQFTIGQRNPLSAVLEAHGFTAGSRLISIRRCTPTANVARLLKVATRTEVLEVEQVLTGNERAIAVATVWLPYDRFERVAAFLKTGSLRRALAQVGVASFRRKLISVESRFASDAERKHLGLPSRSILLHVEGVSVDDDGEPTHAYHYRFDAERISLSFEP